LNWTVPGGSIYGLLGRNGAGKSTALKMLIGLVLPTSGDASIGGFDMRKDSVKIRRMTGYVPELKTVHRSLTVSGFLRFYGTFFPDWSMDSALNQLEKWRVPVHRRMRKLSKGMNAKVLLAAVLAWRPRLLLLDEPTEGLDPESTEEVLSMLAGRAAEGACTIVISSHRLDEIERICDHVAFLESGGLALAGELDDLRASCKTIEVECSLSLETVRTWGEVHSAMAIGETLRVVTQREPSRVIERLAALRPRRISVHDSNLREIYLSFCSRPNEVTS
jgi:ABC-2 type transport system ATP-binding protein